MRRSCLLVADMQRSAQGAVGNQCSYERAFTPYGYAPVAPGPLTAFAGQRLDPLTACYHLGNGHRLYGPGLMRFLSPDNLSPFGQGGLNSYAYCAGNPINYIDPSGKFWTVLGSIEMTRSTSVAAYVGLNLAALTSRIQSRSALWASRQLMVESALVLTGVGMLFSGSQRLEPVALGMISLGNASSIIKSGVTIARNLAGGLRQVASVAGQNLRYVSGFEVLPVKARSAPTSPPPQVQLAQQPAGHVVINVNPHVVNIDMSRQPSPAESASSIRRERRHSTGSIQTIRL
ncbi:RHS repeat-associated core domain-containing protein [Pseudomonas sp. SAR267]|uniref:RHS repeat-associated core domain-containing protein n=1 Tax=unclassified Pseudomonas TaxID=196821 RepID=UPI0028ACF74E|nr:RHS repeat-associated core domain-containing protein [Pseudomonas sp.]